MARPPRAGLVATLLSALVTVTTAACQQGAVNGTTPAATEPARAEHTAEEAPGEAGPPDAATAEKLLDEFGCASCEEPVHVVPGLTYEDESAYLILSAYTTGKPDDFGADTKVAVFYVRARDGRLLADNTEGRNTGFSFLPDVPAGETWAVDEAGSFFLLTQDVRLPDQQGIAWLRQDDLPSVERFGRAHVHASGQRTVEVDDLDNDGHAEVVGQWAPVTALHPDRDIAYHYKFSGDTGLYHPWRCAESTDGGQTYPAPVPIDAKPCNEFSYPGVPWGG